MLRSIACGVRVEIGPVACVSARAWVAYATDPLAVLRELHDPSLPEPVLDAFAALLDAWRPIAASMEPFRWSGDEAPERVKYLLHGLYLAGEVTESEAAAGRARLRPAVADEFHFVLVREILDALEHESDTDAHFVREMRDVWGIARDN
jgi:hypothetical protein